jgi:calcium-dependent protein kinase
MTVLGTNDQDPALVVQRRCFLFHHNHEDDDGKFQDHYKLGKQIGDGGSSKIFVCTHKRTRQKRAVKQIPKSNISSREKFLNEVAILGELDHPNLLRLYESFEDEEDYFIVTDFAAGGDLYDYLSANYRNMTECDIATLMKQILICVNHCHQHNVVHCDIKPENILLEHDKRFERLTLCDMGFSQFSRQHQHTHNTEEANTGEETSRLTRCIGTPLFVAPEVYERNYGPKCDVWSCGVLAFFLLAGEFPFPGQTPRQIYSQIKSRENHFELAAWSHISKEGKSFVQAMLTKDDHNRPSAEEALGHSWFQLMKQQQQQQTIAGTMTLASWNRNLIQFSAKQKLKQATYAFVVAQLTSKSRKKVIDDVFKKADKNFDGRLSKEELRASFQHRGKILSEEELDDLLNRVDINQDGWINYWEFTAAAMNASTMLCSENLKIAFDVFDKSKSESITADDLKSLFQDPDCLDQIDDSVIDAIIQQVDANRDGEISYEEFAKMMQENILPPKRPHSSVL